MSTEAALLRAIRDMPDEDTPRLVYADYLDEDGYSPRAEFIRVQIERSQLPERDPRRSKTARTTCSRTCDAEKSKSRR